MSAKKDVKLSQKGKVSQPAKKGIPTTNRKADTSDKLAGQIEALKQMRAEGLLTVPELVEALNLLRA